MAGATGHQKPYIFVIGPMGEGKGAFGGVDISLHVPNIGKALEIIQSRLRSEGALDFNFEVPTTPHAHEINEFVLPRIDRSDIGIADLSGQSPNVFYELAYFHSLGVPVVALEPLKRKKDPSTPWYATTREVRRPTSFAVDDLVAVLESPLRQILSANIDGSTFSNPISQVYGGIPLVDISAASGLAAGYFENFLKTLLDIDGPLDDEFPEYERLKKIVIVRPDTVSEMDELEARMKASLPVIRRVIEPKGRIRELRFDQYKSYIVDFPKPIRVLRFSPRYVKLMQRLKKMEGANVEAEILKIERKWISTFFAVLEEADSLQPNSYMKRLEFRSLDEILALP